MKKALALGIGVLALAFGGFAVAGVGVGGDNNGTVTIGQSLLVTVSDSFFGNLDPSRNLVTLPCDANSQAIASGHFGVGPLGPAEGGTGWLPLTVTCSNSTWTYSGSVTLTVPQDAGSSEWVSVAVQEWVPVYSIDCAPPCLWKNDYNFNHTYTVALPVTTSASSGSTTTSGTTTVTEGTTTVTIPVTTTSTTATSAPTQTVTKTTTVSQTTTVTVTVPDTLAINAPSMITIRRTGGFIYVTITSNDRRSLQTLCWRDVSTAQQTCARSHGVWRVKLRKTPGKRVFLLKENGRVVARKAVNLKLKP